MPEFHPLPGRTTDRSAAYEDVLRELLRLTGAEAPPWSDDPRRRRTWRFRTARIVGGEVARANAPDAWFGPLLRAAVYEPDPSHVRHLVDPAVEAFGRRRVREALLAYLEDGTAADAAGAARAWYPTLIGQRFLPGTRTPTPETAAELAKYCDLDRRYADAALRRFVTDDDLDLRRCLLPGLSFRAESYPAELRELADRAREIARSSDDEYLRHRVEIQPH
jgi:hypothetical protein